MAAMIKIVSSICTFPVVAPSAANISVENAKCLSERRIELLDRTSGNRTFRQTESRCERSRPAKPLCPKANRHFRVEIGPRRRLERSGGIARFQSTDPRKSCCNFYGAHNEPFPVNFWPILIFGLDRASDRPTQVRRVTACLP
jgi:hypothetical protein